MSTDPNLWDVFQHWQIDKIAESTSQTRQQGVNVDRRLSQETQRLEAKIDALALICESMWELIQERTGLTQQDIQLKMDEIDLRDGRLDGKIGYRRVTCSHCQRQTLTRQSNCMYCGEEIAR